MFSCWFAFNSSQFIVLEEEFTVVDDGGRRHGYGEKVYYGMSISDKKSTLVN